MPRRRRALAPEAGPAGRPGSGVAPPVRRLAAIGGPEGLPLPQAAPPAWSVNNARSRGLWTTTQGTGIRVAHPDTGYTHHEQIDTARLLAALGHNFEENTDD